MITTEIALHCCLRWLAGGSYHEIRLLAGISRATIYVYCHRVIRAVNQCPYLSYNLPNTPEKIEEASDGFKSISSHDVMEGFVGGIDGILLRTIILPKKSVEHVKTFFSGHYYAYGLNILAACDH